MNYKDRLVYVLFIVLTMCLFVGLTYKVAEAKWTDWFTGGVREVVILTPPAPKTLDGEIDRLAIKYEVSSSTIRAVAKCESSLYGNANNKNIDSSGRVWSQDWGYLQVNDYYHEQTMANMGLDIHNEWDSLEYGFMLMKSQGLQPWSASRHCWSKLL